MSAIGGMARRSGRQDGPRGTNDSRLKAACDPIAPPRGEKVDPSGPRAESCKPSGCSDGPGRPSRAPPDQAHHRAAALRGGRGAAAVKYREPVGLIPLALSRVFESTTFSVFRAPKAAHDATEGQVPPHPPEESPGCRKRTPRA
eukprot:2113140-Pyramimonas_sp.AAC.1